MSYPASVKICAKYFLLVPEAILVPFAILAEKILGLFWSLKFFRLWGISPNPEWFDHDFDIFFFKKWRKPHFLKEASTSAND